MIWVHFQVNSFNITIIQVCTPTINAIEAKVDQLYEHLKDPLELTPEKDVLFIIGYWNAKVGVTGKFGLGEQMKQGKG